MGRYAREVVIVTMVLKRMESWGLKVEKGFLCGKMEIGCGIVRYSGENCLRKMSKSPSFYGFIFQ